VSEVTQADLDAALLRVEETLGAEDANLIRAEFDRFNGEIRRLNEILKRQVDLNYEAICSTV